MKIQNLLILTIISFVFATVPVQAAIPVYKTLYPYNWIGAEQKVQKMQHLKQQQEEQQEQQDIKSLQDNTKKNIDNNQ